jgi:hypothetical protein
LDVTGAAIFPKEKFPFAGIAFLLGQAQAQSPEAHKAYD